MTNQNPIPIHNELSQFKNNPNRILSFEQKFTELLKKYTPHLKHHGHVFKTILFTDETGNTSQRDVLDFSLLTELIDRTGHEYDLYDFNTHHFKLLPSKEFLLLVVVALELNDHIDEVLASAGYSTYMKNLNEFIILVGLKNNQPLDVIRDKLIDYGYRGDKAIDLDFNYDSLQHDSRENFQKLLTKYCEAKGKKLKDVVRETGLYSVRWDADKNRYYYDAFTGTGNLPVRLTNDQVFRLFAVLSLSKEEQLELANQMIENHFLVEDEERYIVELIHEGALEFLKQPTQSTRIDEMKATEVSVHTKFIQQKMTTITWAEMDRFIYKTFGDIRSFALFFDDVLKYEKTTLSQFTERSGLANSALYEYRNGLSIPEVYRLTVIASLMERMNEYIYYTLLKKAGKFEFGEKSDSPLIMIMQALLQANERPGMLFGQLFDVLEWILQEEKDIAANYAELVEAYGYQCETLARYLLNEKHHGITFSRPLQDFFKSLLDKKKRRTITLTEMFSMEKWAGIEHELRAICDLLKKQYAFSDTSPLIKAIHKHPDLHMEE